MSVNALRFVAISAAVLTSGAAAVAQGYRYEVIPIGEQYGIAARDINHQGVITGGRSGFAFTLDQSNLTVLPRLPGSSYDSGFKVNQNQEVLGEAEVGVLTKSVLWVDGKPIDLGMVRGEAGGDAASDLNDSLQVSAFVNGRPAIWEKGTVSFLDLPSQYLFGSASGINNHGDCVGGVHDGDNYHAALWDQGKLSSLHPSGYVTSYANEIAENGDIGGEVTRPGFHTAAFWRGGTEFIDLGGLEPGVNVSWFNDLNSMGQVVGQSANSSGQFRGFLWENGKMLSLTDLVEPGWVIANAHAINDRGQILAGGGNGFIAGSVLLNPVPEASTGVAAAAFVFLLCVLRYRR